MKQLDDKVLYAVIVLACIAPILFILSSDVKKDYTKTEIWLSNYTKQVSQDQLIRVLLGTKSDLEKNVTIDVFLDDLKIGSVDAALGGLRFYDIELEKAYRGKYVLKILIYWEDSGFGSKDDPYYLLLNVDVT